MYFIVKLKFSGVKKIIPSKWIENLHLTRLLKYGVTYERKKTNIVFISPNSMEDEPDFKLEILQQFDEMRKACYHACVWDVFCE